MDPKNRLLLVREGSQGAEKAIQGLPRLSPNVRRVGLNIICYIYPLAMAPLVHSLCLVTSSSISIVLVLNRFPLHTFAPYRFRPSHNFPVSVWAP